MKILPPITAFIILFALTAAAADPAGTAVLSVPLTMRARIQPFHADNSWVDARLSEAIVPSQTAIIITDMWDQHWCTGATKRVAEIAQIMEPLIVEARKKGILIIHSPSETMDFYEKTEGRRVAETAPRLPAPPEIRFKDDVPLPFDDSDGGCDTPPDKFHKAWKREISVLSVRAGDVISDSGTEVYDVLKQRHITTVLYMGVHANKCILNRTFGIRQMSKWGIRCILVRDLTDVMYNPAMKPFVSHAEGVDLMVQYIEQYLAPTTLSGDLMTTLRSAAITLPRKP